MHKACVFASEDAIKTLIQNGADTNAVNNDGENASDKCCLQCLIGDCFQKCKLVHGKLIIIILIRILGFILTTPSYQIKVSL